MLNAQGLPWVYMMNDMLALTPGGVEDEYLAELAEYAELAELTQFAQLGKVAGLVGRLKQLQVLVKFTDNPCYL